MGFVFTHATSCLSTRSLNSVVQIGSERRRLIEILNDERSRRRLPFLTVLLSRSSSSSPLPLLLVLAWAILLLEPFPFGRRRASGTMDGGWRASQPGGASLLTHGHVSRNVAAAKGFSLRWDLSDAISSFLSVAGGVCRKSSFIFINWVMAF